MNVANVLPTIGTTAAPADLARLMALPVKLSAEVPKQPTIETKRWAP